MRKAESLLTEVFYEFGAFRLDVRAGRLFAGDTAIKLAPKVLQCLILLVENQPRVVGKEEFFREIWADTYVEDNALSYTVSQLRKTLAEFDKETKYVETVPKRGFRFAAEIRKIVSEPANEMILQKRRIEEVWIEEIETDAAAPQTKLLPPAPRKTNRLLLVAAVLVLVAVAGGWLYRKNQTPPGNDSIKSIAVLPLKPIAAAGADKVLSLGLADTLITHLGASEKIVVRPVSSVSQYADSEFDALAVGQKLRADAILDGSFQRAENRLRVNARLLRVADGKQIWAGTFDETKSDIFKLQDEISKQAASALMTNLNNRERELILKRYTENVAAYEAYQRGRYFFFNRGNDASFLDKAIGEFEQARNFDVNYALAYAGLADALARKANDTGNHAARRAFYEQAKINALKALAIDENLAEAHASIGWIHRIYDWNWAESEKHLRRAIDLAPNVADHYRLYAVLLITLGRTAEAVEYNRQAKRLDPVMQNDAWALYCNRQFEESAAGYAEQLQLADTAERRRGLALAYLQTGKLKQAIEIIENAPPSPPDDFSVQVVLTIAYFQVGDAARGEKLLGALEKRAADGDWARLAGAYCVSGRNEQAVAALQKALETRDDRLMWIKSNPHFDPLRDKPGFLEILRRMNL